MLPPSWPTAVALWAAFCRRFAAGVRSALGMAKGLALYESLVRQKRRRARSRCAGDPSLRLKNGCARDDAGRVMLAKIKGSGRVARFDPYGFFLPFPDGTRFLFFCLPTACAVGCILPSLRGWSRVARFIAALGALRHPKIGGGGAESSRATSGRVL